MLLVDDRLKAAREHAEAGRHDNAALLYEGILDVAPGHPEALSGLIEIQMGNGDLEAAQGLLKQANARTTKDPRFLALSAKILILSEQLAEAETLVDQALALDPDQSEAALLKAEFLAKAGRLEEAEALLIGQKDKNPQNTEILQGLAKLYASFGLFGPALSLAQEALYIAPEKAAYNALVGEMLSQLGDHTRATSFFEKAHLTEPNNPEYMLYVAANSAALGQLTSAVKLAKRATVLFPDMVQAWLCYIKIMAERNDAVTALREFAPVAKRSQSRIETTIALAAAYRLAGHPVQALKLLAPLRQNVEKLPKTAQNQLRGLLRDCFLITGQVDEVAQTIEAPLLARLLGIEPEEISNPEILKRALNDAVFVIDPSLSSLEFMVIARFLSQVRALEDVELVGPSAFGQVAGLFGFPKYLANDVPSEAAVAGSKISFPCSHVLTLPPVVRGEVAAAIPYLKVNPDLAEKWRTALSEFPRPWVGLCWDASETGLKLDQLLPSLPFGKGTRVALNWDESRHQLKGVDGVIDAGRHFKSLSDLAALISVLDVVVGPDSLALHAAGAAGVPGILIYRFNRPWYWVAEDDHSLWYPSVETVGTDRAAPWSDVMEEISGSLLSSFSGKLGKTSFLHTEHEG